MKSYKPLLEPPCYDKEKGRTLIPISARQADKQERYALLFFLRERLDRLYEENVRVDAACGLSGLKSFKLFSAFFNSNVNIRVHPTPQIRTRINSSPALKEDSAYVYSASICRWLRLGHTR